MQLVPLTRAARRKIVYTTLKSDIRIIHASFIKSREELEPAPPGDLPALPKLDQMAISDREGRALARAARDAAKIGVGVTAEAQDIFNHLSNIFPCEWRGTDIRVMDTIMLVAPYQVENCTGSNPEALARIRMVLAEHFRKQAASAAAIKA